MAVICLCPKISYRFPGAPYMALHSSYFLSKGLCPVLWPDGNPELESALMWLSLSWDLPVTIYLIWMVSTDLEITIGLKFVCVCTVSHSL